MYVGAESVEDQSRLPTIPSHAIQLALEECHRYLTALEHEDIDLPVSAC